VVTYWGRRWIIKYATDILAVSKSVMQASSKWNKTVKTSLWNAGIDIDLFCPPETPVASNVSLLWVGGLLKGKRVDMLLSIFQKVARTAPEAKLTIVGAGPREESLKKQAAEMRLEDSIIFLGRRRDIPELLKEATVFVTCSQFEGLPTVLLEAQACGTPVVASDIPPHREVLCDEMLPFLFNAADLDDAAQKICAVIGDAKLRDKLGQAARDHAVNRYNATRQIADLENFYMTALDSTCKS
jgi:glycosyltransferase involved in cell wall biosynthesis